MDVFLNFLVWYYMIVYNVADKWNKFNYHETINFDLSFYFQ